MIYALKRYVSTGLLFAIAGISVPVPVLADTSVDTPLVQIEQVDVRLSNAGLLADKVLKYVADQEGLQDQNAASMLQSATRTAFPAQTLTMAVQESLQKISDPAVDGARLAKFAEELKANRQKIRESEQRGDKTALQDMQADLSSKANGSRLQQLADLMASPELAAETAVTAQAMYLAIHSFFNPDEAQFASLSPEQLKAIPEQILTYVRQKTENEKPYAKESERANEKLRVELALAALSEDDLNFLLEFYQSPQGKAKRDALVESYQHISAEANSKMLQNYFVQLAEAFKKNPKAKSAP